jgi:hypothetical protein
MAQVVSVNVVGFINKDCPANAWTLIANQLNGTNNNLLTILPSVPAGTEVWMWDGVGQTFNQMVFVDPTSGWLDVGLGDFNNTFQVPPGTGIFVHNVATTNFTITLVGEVPQNATAPLTQTIYPGFTLLGSIPPVSKSLSDTATYNFPAVSGMNLWFWDLPAAPQNWTQYNYTGTLWIDVGLGDVGDPTPAVGAGFWVDGTATPPGSIPPAGLPWAMTFSVK